MSVYFAKNSRLISQSKYRHSENSVNSLSLAPQSLTFRRISTSSISIMSRTIGVSYCVFTFYCTPHHSSHPPGSISIASFIILFPELEAPCTQGVMQVKGYCNLLLCHWRRGLQTEVVYTGWLPYHSFTSCFKVFWQGVSTKTSFPIQKSLDIAISTMHAF